MPKTSPWRFLGRHIVRQRLQGRLHLEDIQLGVLAENLGDDAGDVGRGEAVAGRREPAVPPRPRARRCRARRTRPAAAGCSRTVWVLALVRGDRDHRGVDRRESWERACCWRRSPASRCGSRPGRPARGAAPKKSFLVVPRLRLQTCMPFSIAQRSAGGEDRAAPAQLAPSTWTLYSSHSGATARMMPAQAVPWP